MGNSCGGLVDYWDAIRTHPGLQGGFVWDWVDQALVQVLPDGTERLAYGGDFGDEPNDGAFVCDGLVAADRTPHPSLLELAKVIATRSRSARSTPRAACSRSRTSTRSSTSRGCSRRGSVQVDGEEVASGELEPLDVAPGASSAVRGAGPVARRSRAGQRAHLTLSFRTRADLPWAPAGHEVAWEQVRARRRRRARRAPGPPPRRPRLARRRWSRRSRCGGRRSTTRRSVPGHAARWERLGLRDAGATSSTTEHESTTDDGALRRHARGRRAGRARRHPPRRRAPPARARACTPSSGSATGRTSATPTAGASARFGRWTTPVDDWTVPYVHPQASGNRTGVRWLRFLDADGEPVLTIDELDDLEVTVAPRHRRGGGRRRPPRGPPGARRLLRVDRRAPARRRIGARAVPTWRPRTASAPAPTAGRTASADALSARAQPDDASDRRNGVARLPRRASATRSRPSHRAASRARPAAAAAISRSSAPGST